MPPKRAKASVKVATTTEPPRPRATRAAAKDATIVMVAEGDDGVKLAKQPSRRTRNSKTGQETEVDMSGSLAEEETHTAPNKRAKATTESPDAQETVQKPAPRTRGRPPRTVKKAVQSEANKKAIEALEKRMKEDARRLEEGTIPTTASASGEEEPVPEAARNVAAAAEVQAAPSLPPTNISPVHRAKAAPSTLQRKPSSTLQRAPGTVQKSVLQSAVRAPQSSLKVQSTPGVENSVLALANFKRRARQPSLLQMVQNPELAQDLGYDTTDFTLGSDEDDFAPHDESTPLHLSKTQQASDRQQPSAPTTPARGSSIQQRSVNDDLDSLYDATPRASPHVTELHSTSTSRKRKSEALEDLQHSVVQIPHSQPSLDSSPSLPSQSQDWHDRGIIPATNPDQYHHDSPSRSQISDTYADPISSSPMPSPSSLGPTENPTLSPTQSRRLALTATGRARRASITKPAKSSKPVTTAALRALLPKRRIQRQQEARRQQRAKERSDDFSVPTSSSLGPISVSSDPLSSSEDEAEDADDLSFSTHRRGGAAQKQNRKQTAPKKKAAKTKPGVLSPVSARKTQRGTTGKAASSKPTTTAVGAGGKRTYGRSASSSEKENNPAKRGNGGVMGERDGSTSPLTSLTEGSDSPADDSVETVVATGKVKGGGKGASGELKERKQFFDEVDTWEMEFESAPSLGNDGFGSSPAWR